MKSFVVWRYQLDVTVFPRGVLILFTNRRGALGEIIKNMLHFMALTTVFLITSMLYKPGLESKGDHSWEPVFSSDFMQFSSVHFYLVKIWDNTGIPIGIASWQGSPEETRRLIKPGLPSHKEISKMINQSQLHGMGENREPCTHNSLSGRRTVAQLLSQSVELSETAKH